MDNELLREILAKLDKLEAGQNQTNTRLDGIDSRIASLETDVGAIRHIVERLDNNERKIWGHLLEQVAGVRE